MTVGACVREKWWNGVVCALEISLRAREIDLEESCFYNPSENISGESEVDGKKKRVRV